MEEHTFPNNPLPSPHLNEENQVQDNDSDATL